MAASTALLAVLTSTGCSTLLAARTAQEHADRLCIVSGTVTTNYPARGPLVVALFTGTREAPVLVDYFTALKPGPWVFGVDPGSYWVAAFEDVNGDGAYDDEPFLRPDPDHPLVLKAGERVSDLRLVIPRDGRALRTGHLPLTGLMARDPAEQQHKSIYALTHTGMVTTLDDPRFDFDTAREGMWDFYDFLLQGRAGLYLLEPYDPKRVPVLFVHGIGGTPRAFAPLIAALDRTRFQPWVLYYPSGGRLDVIVTWLDQIFTRLETEYGFTRAAVVAHSMGGLVSRGFVLQHHDRGSDSVRTFVTISSPLGGMKSAGEGVERSPVVVRSWYGLAPGSPFLDGLFYEDPDRHTRRRRLAADTEYHLLFGFKGGGPSGSGDGIVPLESQLRPEAQEEAASIRGYDETHTGILDSPAVAGRVKEILAGSH